MAGHRVSGWRLACPSCGAPSLLPGTLARSGARRDQSWVRMTGFPKEVEGDIATVLAAQGSGA